MRTGLHGVELTLVETLDEASRLAEWLARPRAILGVDTETEGLDWFRDDLRTVQLGDETHGWVLPWPQWGGLGLDLLNRYDGTLAFQNAKFDLHFLEPRGFKVKRHLVHDTKLMAHLFDPTGPQGLKPLGEKYVDGSSATLANQLAEGQAKHGWDWATTPVDFPPYWQYAAMDPVITAKLAAHFWPLIQPYRELYDVELAVQQILTDMERKGALIDVEYAAIRRHELLEQAARMRDRIAAQWGVRNPGSRPELIAALEAAGETLDVVTAKGEVSVDEVALSRLAHPLAAAVLQLRHAEKTATTYFGNYLKYADADHRLHAHVNQTGARTGRMSVGRPSLQNIPRTKATRRPFIVEEGHRMVLADFDQIELRLMAHFAQEESMLQAIHAGVDLHTFTAQRAYGVEAPTKQQRQVAKSSNFAIIYGAGPSKFAETAGLSLAEANLFLAAYDRSFPRVRAFITELHTVGRQHAVSEGQPYVLTWGGRRLPCEPDKLYVLTNYLVQGSAADVLKRRMVAVDQAGLGAYLRLPVHDELMLEVPSEDVADASHVLREAMQDLTSFRAPLSVGVEVVDNWGEKYD